MFNAELNFVSFLGIALAIAGAGLYFIRQFRPGLARDYDVFFSAVALGAGAIMLFNGWRYDPIMQFAQFLITGSALFFAYESIRLRSIATEQAKRRTPVVDDERPVSRVYRAELDDWEDMNNRGSRRRIPASDSAYGDFDEDERYRSQQRRPLYEERRPPAGRLQPGDDRPRRPSNDRSMEQFDDRGPDRRYDRDPRDVRDARDGRPDRGGPDRGPNRGADRGPGKGPDRGNYGNPPTYGSSDRPRERPSDRPGDRPSDRSGAPRDEQDGPKGRDRTLNVRPYSERPETSGMPSGDEGGGYVDFRPVNPPDSP
jgi:Ycf66 protein N-terminus